MFRTLIVQAGRQVVGEIAKPPQADLIVALDISAATLEAASPGSVCPQPSVADASGAAPTPAEVHYSTAEAGPPRQRVIKPPSEISSNRLSDAALLV